MIDELKPYSEYMDTGSPWLGNIPAHWELPRLGSVFRERGETNEQKQMSQVLSVLKDIGVIRYEDKGNIGNKKSEDIGRYKVVRPDDIVVNCMNVIIGSAGRSSYAGCLSPVYYVLARRSLSNHPRYLAAVFATKPFQESLVRIGNGILAHRMRIPMELLKLEPFPLPPPDEQAAIVRFLDHANGKIERAIRAKRKLIALLNEQKQAIIHRAVTRGLDPAVTLKPSGIPWLGDVPEHWEVLPLRKLVTPGRHITYGIVQPGEPKKSGRFMIRGKDYSSGWAEPETIFRVSPEIENPYTRSRLKPGDIVMTIVGAGVGNVAVVPDWLDGANITQTTARIALNSAVANPSFVELVLQGPVGRRNLERYVYGSA